MAYRVSCWRKEKTLRWYEERMFRNVFLYMVCNWNSLAMVYESSSQWGDSMKWNNEKYQVIIQTAFWLWEKSAGMELLNVWYGHRLSWLWMNSKGKPSKFASKAIYVAWETQKGCNWASDGSQPCPIACSWYFCCMPTVDSASSTSLWRVMTLILLFLCMGTVVGLMALGILSKYSFTAEVWSEQYFKNLSALVYFLRLMALPDLQSLLQIA